MNRSKYKAQIKRNLDMQARTSGPRRCWYHGSMRLSTPPPPRASFASMSRPLCRSLSTSWGCRGPWGTRNRVAKKVSCLHSVALVCGSVQRRAPKLIHSPIRSRSFQSLRSLASLARSQRVKLDQLPGLSKSPNPVPACLVFQLGDKLKSREHQGHEESHSQSRDVQNHVHLG